MDNRLHPSVTPCRFLIAGHCRSGDGCQYAHDSIPQPCLSASQITHRLDNLSGNDITDPAGRRRANNLRARLRYKAKRRCIAPQLVHSGIMPTKKAIRRYYAKIRGGAANRTTTAPDVGECRPVLNCGNNDGEGDQWVAVKVKSNERRMRKLEFRKKSPGHRPVRIVKRYRAEQVCCLRTD
jgi:hypothetical protein